MQIAECGVKNIEKVFFFLVINSEIRIPKSEIKVYSYLSASIGLSREAFLAG